MNIKINTACFIILLFLLIGVAAASDGDNETLQKTIKDPNENLCQTILHENVKIDDNTPQLKSTTLSPDKLEKSVANNTPVLQASKTKSVAGTSKAKSTSTKTNVILKVANVKMHYNDGSKLTITLKNKNKKAIKNAKIKISVLNKVYTGTTNANGQLIMKINFECGKYNLVTTYDGSKKYNSKSVKSTITVLSTIKNKWPSIKYYTDKSPYYSTFYDKKGKILKNTAVKVNVDGKGHNLKTNKKGVAKLVVTLSPGNHVISTNNPKTGESKSATVTVKSILETSDLTMNESDGSKFSVKVLNSKGKAAPNKRVTLKVNGKIYTPTSNINGIATQVIDFVEGKYSITTQYEGLINTNQITVNKGFTHTQFSHVTSIPNYVNVTYPYVFHNSAYALKTGFDGIIRMSKNELFTIQISETQSYLFSQTAISGANTIVIGYTTHLVPFDGSGVKSDYNRDNLKGDGILIYTTANYTNIEFRCSNENNVDMFGVYMSKGMENSELITYIQNNRIKAKVNVYTVNYDETGLRYNLAKYHGTTIYDFDYKSYEEIIGNNTQFIRFANTGKPVTFSYFGKSIVGYESKTDIVTRFIVNGKEELEKGETITYGLDDNYNRNVGYEVLQSYAIVNEKVDEQLIDSWISKSQVYLTKQSIMNVYSMFLTSLSTVLMADKLADSYSKEYDVTWKRSNTVTVLGGMNLNKTYLHVLNADMGMSVSGNNNTNILLFKMLNSLTLPELENIALKPVHESFNDNSTYSLEDLFKNHTSYSIIFSDDLALIQMDNSNTSIIMNQTSGVVNVIMQEEGFCYKGATINTAHDCCSCNRIGNNIVNFLKNPLFRAFLLNPMTDSFLKNNGYLAGLLAQKAIPYAIHLIGKSAGGFGGAAFSVFGFALKVQELGVTYRTQKEKKDWYKLMDTYTFTRAGIFQQKKVYNIPNNKGSYDYIEVPIKSDFSLDRENALYISNNNVKKLTKNETYNYFSEDYYSLYTVPQKYWNR